MTWECIIIADCGLATYEMPKREGIYLVVAIRRNFSIVDFNLDLDRSFIFRNRGINAGMRDLGDKILYMYEDTSIRAEEEINLIKKMEAGEIEQKTSRRRKKSLVNLQSSATCDPIPGRYTICTNQERKRRLHLTP